MSGRRRLFTNEQLRALIEGGATQTEAAARLGVSLASITKRIKTDNLVFRKPPERGADRPDAAVCEGSLEATGGRYSDLCRWAEANGLTPTQALQRWHALRLTVRPRRN